MAVEAAMFLQKTSDWYFPTNNILLFTNIYGTMIRRSPPKTNDESTLSRKTITSYARYKNLIINQRVANIGFETSGNNTTIVSS